MSAECCGEVVGMNVLTRRDIAGRATYRPTVFVYCHASADSRRGQLVSARHGRPGDEGLRGRADRVTGLHVPEGDQDVVTGVHPKEVRCAQRFRHASLW